MCFGFSLHKVGLIAAVSDDLTSRVRAGDIVREIAPAVGGKGGGRPDLAQAGGTNPEGLTACFDKARTLLRGKL